MVTKLIFPLMGAVGMIWVIWGMTRQNSPKKQNIYCLIGGIFLEIYSIYIHSVIFIPLQLAFIVVTIWNLRKLSKK